MCVCVCACVCFVDVCVCVSAHTHTRARAYVRPSVGVCVSLSLCLCELCAYIRLFVMRILYNDINKLYLFSCSDRLILSSYPIMRNGNFLSKARPTRTSVAPYIVYNVLFYRRNILLSYAIGTQAHRCSIIHRMVGNSLLNVFMSFIDIIQLFNGTLILGLVQLSVVRLVPVWVRSF